MQEKYKAKKMYTRLLIKRKKQNICKLHNDFVNLSFFLSLFCVVFFRVINPRVCWGTKRMLPIYDPGKYRNLLIMPNYLQNPIEVKYCSLFKDDFTYTKFLRI